MGRGPSALSWSIRVALIKVEKVLRERISVIDLNHNRIMIQSMVNIVFKRMLLSQIYWGMFVNIDWQFSWDLFYIDWRLQKYPGVDLDQWSNQPTPSSQMTHAIFLLHRCCLSLSPNLFLSVSLSPFFALFLIMFYLSWFPLNTRPIGCLIIIDRNKLIWTTTLFHLEVAHNKSVFSFLLKFLFWS